MTLITGFLIKNVQFYFLSEMLEEVDCSSLIAVVLRIQASHSFLPSSNKGIFKSTNCARKADSKQRILITHMTRSHRVHCLEHSSPMYKATMPADGLDFVTFLPIEVIELIVSYLDGHDVLACCAASQLWCDVLNRDVIWRMLCRQNDWRHDDLFPSSSWRKLYWLQKNWRGGQFKTNHHLIEGDDCLKVGLNREYVVLCHVFSTQIWKFSPKPILLQEICCGDFHFQTNVSDRSLVIRLRRSFHLYYQNKSDGRYSLVKVLSQDKCSADFDSDLDLESATTYCGCNRLVVIQRTKKEHSIAMWHLDSGNKICCISMDAHVKHILKAIISSNRLYLVVVVDNEYHLKIYDFLKNIWIHQLVVFKNIAFGVVPPEIQVNDKLIVCFSAVDINRDLCYGYSPMKVWDYNGKFLTSVILNSGRVDYFAFCLVDQFVIYRSSENVVKVWNPRDDKEICELPVEKEICKIDRSVGSLVVFSYEKFFDVWDWKRKTKLYRAKTEYENYDSLIHNRIEINAFHYTKQSRNKKCFSVFSFYDQDLSNSNNFLIPYKKGALKYER